MQRYLTVLFLFLLTVPVGFSIQGCANKNSTYCNGAGYGYTKDQLVAISLQPQATGVSVAFSQTAQLPSPTATDCTGAPAKGITYTYGTTDRTIADISPTGVVCAGTWNYNTPAVASYTTCLPTNKQGVAFITAQAQGFTSNQVAIYSHPPITSLSVVSPMNNGQPECLSQGQTALLDANAYCTSTGPATGPTPGTCPSSSVAPGQPVLICSPNFTNTSSGYVYGSNDCNNIIGHIVYSASNSAVVTINTANGVATAQEPGSTLISGTISNTGATSGYFYTCPPKTISLSVPITGATNVSVTPNNPQPLTATVTDVNGNVINGLPLNYVSTNPATIGVSNTGSVTATYPSSTAVFATCEPSVCNPAPINLIGSLGTGAPVLSNSVQVTSPGQVSTYIWVASPSSPYFVPTDLTTGTTGTPIKLPYTPNSMLIDQAGDTLYFGSYRELMIYNAVTNGLTAEDLNVPGIVLAVDPDNSSLVINDQYRGLIYIYHPATSTTNTSGTKTTTGATYTSIGGIAQSASFSSDGQTAYIVGTNVLYVYNTYTGWSTTPLPASQGSPTTGVCPANNSSTVPNTPGSNPPNSPSNPNNAYNVFCSPEAAVTVPSSAVFLSGSSTAAYGFCPETTVNPIVPYPEATVVNVPTDHLAATIDGKHIIGATANPPTLTDISITTPIDSCPAGANGQTTGLTFSPTPVFNQASLAAYGISNINQVVAATNSQEAFITYSSNATNTPAGGALLPVYEPSSQSGTLGTLTNVKLSGSAIAPISGIFSPDNTIFFAATTGDDQLHLINTKTLLDTQQLNPKLTDAYGNPVPPVFLAVKPRPTT